MDVKVIDVKTSLKELLEGNGIDQLLNSLKEALKGKEVKPITEEEMRTNRDMIDLLTKKLAGVSNRMEEAVMQEPDRRLVASMGQAHAYLNTAGRSLVDVVELLGDWLDRMKHNRECECAKSEAATEAPPAETSTVYASSHGKASEPESAPNTGATAGAE